MVLPKAWLLLLLVALTFLAACESEDDTLPTVQMDIPFRQDGVLTFISPDGDSLATIAIEIAEGDSARQRGLMQRRGLPAQGGMLFLDDRAREQSFWMRNTPLPLDILFVGADSQVINIAERTRPYSDSALVSAAPAQYVLEVRAGFTDRYGITDSTRLVWRRDE